MADRFRWDFTGKRVSFRKGGRIALCRKGSSVVLEWIAPEDQEEFQRQYDEHLEKVGRDLINDPRWKR